MTIQKQQPTPQSHSNMEEALSGNPAAGELAQKAAALMEQLMGSTVTPKLRDLPTKADRLNAIADAIEKQVLVKEGIGFNMRPYYLNAGGNYELIKDTFPDQTGHMCGTVACIGGWVSLMDDPSVKEPSAIEARATAILGLNHDEMQSLFYAYGAGGNSARGALTDKQAVAVLRHFASNNEVRWDLFDANGKRK